jgi:hypothetical protein
MRPPSSLLTGRESGTYDVRRSAVAETVDEFGEAVLASTAEALGGDDRRDLGDALFTKIYSGLSATADSCETSWDR